MHIYGDYFITIRNDGVRIRKHYIKDDNVLPGVPNMWFTLEQWERATAELHNFMNLCFGDERAKQPCFVDKSSHYDQEKCSDEQTIPVFIGCKTCVPFLF